MVRIFEVSLKYFALDINVLWSRKKYNAVPIVKQPVTFKISGWVANSAALKCLRFTRTFSYKSLPYKSVPVATILVSSRRYRTEE